MSKSILTKVYYFMTYDIINKFNNEDGFSLIRVITALIIIFLIGLLIPKVTSHLLNISFLRDIFIIEQEDSTTLMNVIFQVQSTIVALTTVIISALIVLNKKKAYGIKILTFTMVKRKNFLTFYEELILNLILILFEYYFVSHCMLESSVFIFLISTCMIIHMIYISMKWIAFESDIENEIKEYILEEIKNKIQSENFENSKE